MAKKPDSSPSVSSDETPASDLKIKLAEDSGQDEPVKKKAVKPTKAETNKRMSIIQELVLQCWPRRTICQYVSQKTDWNVTDRSIDRYVKKVREEIKQSSAWDKDLEVGKALRQLDDLYRRCMKISDYKTALQVLRQRTELLQLKHSIVSDADRGEILEWIDNLKNQA